jgi:poly-beta-1,6-N-acetyl-D-glucosamine synthase
MEPLNSMIIKKKYVLLTAAKNEGLYIEKTLESVANQTILPQKWIIINDGSTDDTERIIVRYRDKCKFIELISRQSNQERNFNSKSLALKEAYKLLKEYEYDYIGNLDADVSFENNFYEILIKYFNKDKCLGIIGGVIWEMNKKMWVYSHHRPEWCVGGATQFFRRELFEKIGGYPSLKYGGEDTVAEYLAREYGWKVKAFQELKVYHHKLKSQRYSDIWSKYYQLGIQEYLWGTIISFQLLKCISRFIRKPYVLGGLINFIGYCSYYLSHKERGIPKDIANIIQKQQTERIRCYIVTLLSQR